MLLSICIPTYNRRERLLDCLNSILVSSSLCRDDFKFEICISDNNSNYDINEIIKNFEKKLSIKLNKNSKNLGFANNAIKCIEMAKGEYTWLIGDDDLLTVDCLVVLKNILINNFDKDYFFINSYYLNLSDILLLSRPLNTNNIDTRNLNSVSLVKENKSVNFWDIIDPKVSWEFLIGIFLSIFRTQKWKDSLKNIDKNKIENSGVWTTFENTCLHPIILADAFRNSKAFICSKPLSFNLFGAREWGDLYEFIEIIRIPELLDYYRSKGLNFFTYLYCKNYSLRNFSSYLFKIIIGGKKKGRNYINFKKHVLNNVFFPNFYFSFFRAIFNKLKKLIV